MFIKTTSIIIQLRKKTDIMPKIIKTVTMYICPKCNSQYYEKEKAEMCCMFPDIKIENYKLTNFVISGNNGNIWYCECKVSFRITDETLNDLITTTITNCGNYRFFIDDTHIDEKLEKYKLSYPNILHGMCSEINNYFYNIFDRFTKEDISKVLSFDN